jgi:radical SAM superfamily enzyme YgiQ (UPF0313 family)
MKLRFVYPAFNRHAEDHPELLDVVPCDEYFGPPSLGIASLAAVTPDHWDFDFRDDRFEDLGLDDDIDLVAISTFTPSAKRAMEIADEFRARGKQVVLGGVFPSHMPDVAGEHGSVVIGEADGIWPAVLEDAARGALQPRYEATEAVDVNTLPLPRIDLYLDKECDDYHPSDYPVQQSRGCPMKCVACAIPGSLGRSLRPLPVAHIVGQIEQLANRGKLGSLTEDTGLFPGAPQRHTRKFVQALIETGREAPVSYLGTSMPLVLAADSALLNEMRESGIRMFYLVGGFDPITRQGFNRKNPRQRQRAVDAIKKAIEHGIEPYTSFLLGNDDDDEGSFDEMLAVADEAGLQKAEFAIRTPYPGTPDWHELVAQDRILHRDWSKYNDANVVFKPAQMSPERLLQGYMDIWRDFYASRQSLSKLDARERTIQF